MAPQDEMHEKFGNEQVEGKTDKVHGSGDRGVDLAPEKKRPSPFSEFDPFRAVRISDLAGETDSFLATVSKKQTGIEGLDEDKLRSLQADAEERSRWSETRQDAFRGIIRLGAAVPPRDRRIL